MEMATPAAIDLAKSKGLDLVEVDPNQTVPVCRFIDFGQYLYEKKKAEKKQKKLGKALESKGVRIGPNIGIHDLEVKAKTMRKFFIAGHPVKVTVQFRGREIMHDEIGFEKLKNLIALVEDVSKVDQLPKKVGRQITTLLLPLKK